MGKRVHLFSAVCAKWMNLISVHNPRTLVGTLEEGTEVTFTSPNPETLPLPNPRYLAFHAALASVVHTAGVADQLNDILTKRESIRELSDGSDAEYLDGLLRVVQRCIAETPGASDMHSSS